MDVRWDDEQGRTQRHKEPALVGSLRWAESAEGPGISPSWRSREGSVDTTSTSCGEASAPHGFDAAAAREMRERVRGVSAIAFLARRRSGARKRIDDLGDSPGSYSSEALQLLSPEPQPGPQVGGMLAGVMAARTRHSGGMRLSFW